MASALEVLLGEADRAARFLADPSSDTSGKLRIGGGGGFFSVFRRGVNVATDPRFVRSAGAGGRLALRLAGGGSPGGSDIFGDIGRRSPGGTPSEGRSGSSIVPSGLTDVIPGITSGDTPGSGRNGDCPGFFNVKIAGQCVDLGSVLPGGDPMVTGQTTGTSSRVDVEGVDFGEPVNGRYGVGVIPRVEARAVRSCPTGMVLGEDGVCYKRSSIRKSDRAWDPGVKPLLTGGERNAIRRAAAAGRKLDRAKKQLKKAGRALEKAC